MKEESSISGWSCLPRDLLDSILCCFDDFYDFSRFCSVCRFWRSVALEPDHSHLTDCCRHRLRLHKLIKTCQNQLPVLMVPVKHDSPDSRTLYYLDKRSLYRVAGGGLVSCEIQLPVLHSRRFIGSSRGWLFRVDDPFRRVVTLMNPFFHKVIHLPEVWRCYRNFNIRKAIILPRPDHHHKFDVLLTYDRRLAYWKYTYSFWQFIDFPALFSDFIAFKGQIYAVTTDATLLHVDLSSRQCTVVLEGIIACNSNIRLVESHEGDLLVVKRFQNSMTGNTIGLAVYKLSYSQGKERGRMNCNQIQTIGEQALFLVSNDSVSISTTQFPDCKPNYVYYADRYFDISECYMPLDYNEHILDTNVESPGLGYTPAPSHCPSIPPIWIVPHF